MRTRFLSDLSGRRAIGGRVRVAAVRLTEGEPRIVAQHPAVRANAVDVRTAGEERGQSHDSRNAGTNHLYDRSHTAFYRCDGQCVNGMRRSRRDFQPSSPSLASDPDARTPAVCPVPWPQLEPFSSGPRSPRPPQRHPFPSRPTRKQCFEPADPTSPRAGVASTSGRAPGPSPIRAYPTASQTRLRGILVDTR